MIESSDSRRSGDSDNELTQLQPIQELRTTALLARQLDFISQIRGLAERLGFPPSRWDYVRDCRQQGHCPLQLNEIVDLYGDYWQTMLELFGLDEPVSAPWQLPDLDHLQPAQLLPEEAVGEAAAADVAALSGASLDVLSELGQLLVRTNLAPYIRFLSLRLGTAPVIQIHFREFVGEDSSWPNEFAGYQVVMTDSPFVADKAQPTILADLPYQIGTGLHGEYPPLPLSLGEAYRDLGYAQLPDGSWQRSE